MIISQRVAYTCWARVKFERWWSHSLNDSSQLRASIDPWSRSTTRRIFFQSSCIIHETTPVSLFLPFPPQTFFHQSCHRFSLWFPSLLHLFFLSLSLFSRWSCPLSSLIFLGRICPDTEANLYETACNYWRLYLPFYPFPLGEDRN